MPSAERVRVGYVLKTFPRLSETFILNEILAHESQGLDVAILSLRTPDVAASNCVPIEAGQHSVLVVPGRGEGTSAVKKRSHSILRNLF